jgi:hypothetical protein
LRFFLNRKKCFVCKWVLTGKYFVLTLKRSETELCKAVVFNLLDIVRSSFIESWDDADGGGISSIDSMSHEERAGDGG